MVSLILATQLAQMQLQFAALLVDVWSATLVILLNDCCETMHASIVLRLLVCLV